MHGYPTVEVFGVRYHNLTVAEAVNLPLEMRMKGVRANIFFLNLDCLKKAKEDPEYEAILNDRANLVLSDGIALRLLTRIFGLKMRENCNGTDLCPKINIECARHGYSIFLLGGKPGVAEKAAERLRSEMPDLKIAGSHTGYFDNEDEVVELINRSGADVLYVAMGVPIQEKFIARNHPRLMPRLCLGVGALLDYMSGTVCRAPLWMRRMHMEWLWRVFIEPKRMFRRYVIDGIWFFVYAVYYRLIFHRKN